VSNIAIALKDTRSQLCRELTEQKFVKWAVRAVLSRRPATSVFKSDYFSSTIDNFGTNSTKFRNRFFMYGSRASEINLTA